ncbi:MAG: DUF5676 family membrane protein [Candidatus Anstonellaceae archaeon]
MVCKKPMWYKLGVLFPAISLACGIVIYAVPGAGTWLLEHLTHSRWQFEIQPFDATQFVVGLALWAIIGAAVGWAFERLCDCCQPNMKARR